MNTGRIQLEENNDNFEVGTQQAETLPGNLAMAGIDPYLERQYNNRAAVPEHPQYLQSWAERSRDYRQRADARLDVAYGDSQRQILDIFPANAAPAPVHIYIHGGYWQTLSKDSFSFVAETFNRAGECAVIVNYDLCPQVSVADIIGQLLRAVSWVLEHIHRYGGDASRIQVSGHSAGGHLLAALLTSDWSGLLLAGKSLHHPPFLRLNALSGLFQLEPLMATSINRAVGLDAATAADCSPFHRGLWQPLESCELNLLVGELESDEFKRQSSELKQAWQAGLTVDYRLAPGAHHFSIVDAFVDGYYQSLAVAQ